MKYIYTLYKESNNETVAIIESKTAPMKSSLVPFLNSLDEEHGERIMIKGIEKRDREVVVDTGVPRVECPHCGGSTPKAVHLHICVHCNKYYGKGR